MKTEDLILKDKEVFRVPVTLMDHAQASVPRRPHQLTVTDTAERETRQRAYDAKVSDAWRGAADQTPPPVAATRQVQLTRAYDERVSNAWRNT